MGTVLLTSALGTLVVYTIVRVEQLITSDLWIQHRGVAWLKVAKRASAGQLRDPEYVDRLFERFGGGTTPWLFVGIKSYRLRRLSRHLEASGAYRRARAVNLFRTVFWQYYTFPFLVAILLCALSLTGRHTDSIRYLMLAEAALLIVGYIAICAESVFALLLFGSWSPWYHRFPKVPRSTKQNTKVDELQFAGGALMLLGFVALVPLQLIVDSQFGAHAHGNGVTRISALGWAAREVINWTFTIGDPVPVVNGYGTVADTVCALTALLGLGSLATLLGKAVFKS
ncbi:hypothetical protein [Luteipulveratus mongoliensis]|uniref:Uncharacterized protein n=1 Tax=Luteipulveratus mongoliensis TaxID=571913 RepID=A0A0K1JNL9_9MICO|nr:hypothetical protein [Luteipulveratus mongoliensis]AKU18188.1 hypothetical protein VV02_23955 [Luteipulveratus mongoliensis]